MVVRRQRVDVRVLNREPRFKRKRGEWRYKSTHSLLYSLQYLSDRPGGTDSHSASFGLETNRLRLPAIEPRFLDIPSCSLVTIAAKSRCIVFSHASQLMGPLAVPKIESLSTHSVGD